MAADPWDARAQLDALVAKKRHAEGSLALTGSFLALANAVLLAELLAVNEDRDTFFLVGSLAAILDLAWLVIARRVGLQGRRWTVKARGLERDVVRVPVLYSLWEDSGTEVPAWIAAAFVVAGFAAVFVGVMAYAAWVTHVFG